MPNITIYTRTTCAPCRAVKAWLGSKGFPFTERNVDEDPALMDEVRTRSGYMMVPMILVGDQVISGANFSALSSALTTKPQA